MYEQDTDEITLSFVCPIYDQAEQFGSVYERIKAVAEDFGATYEVLFINDGSTDESLSAISKLARLDGSVKFLDFSRRFGHLAAMAAGLDYAVGRAVITVNCDWLPTCDCIARLIERWQSGAEVVYTVAPVGDGPLVGLWRRIAKAVGVRFPSEPEAVLLDRKAVLAVRSLRRRPASMVDLLGWIGFRQETVPVEAESVARAGRAGKGQIGRFTRRLAPSWSPIRAVGWAGAAVLFSGLAYMLIAGVLALFGTGSFSPVIAVLLGIVGLQLLCLAVVGAWLGRTYGQTGICPAYIVRHSGGFEGQQKVPAVEPPGHQVREASRFSVLT